MSRVIDSLIHRIVIYTSWNAIVYPHFRLFLLLDLDLLVACKGLFNLIYSLNVSIFEVFNTGWRFWETRDMCWWKSVFLLLFVFLFWKVDVLRCSFQIKNYFFGILSKIWLNFYLISFFVPISHFTLTPSWIVEYINFLMLIYIWWCSFCLFFQRVVCISKTVIILLGFNQFSHLIIHFNVLVATLYHMILRASRCISFACTFTHINRALWHIMATLFYREHIGKLSPLIGS